MLLSNLWYIVAIIICGKGLKSPSQQKKIPNVGVPNAASGPTLQWSGNSCNVAGKCIGFHLSNRPFQRLWRQSTHHMGELVLHIHQALCHVLLGNQIVSSLPWICAHFFVSEKTSTFSRGSNNYFHRCTWASCTGEVTAASVCRVVTTSAVCQWWQIALTETDVYAISSSTQSNIKLLDTLKRTIALHMRTEVIITPMGNIGKWFL